MPPFKWCRRPRHLSELLHSLCAQEVSPLSLSFPFFFCHILSNLFAESHRSHSQFNEHPPGLATKKSVLLQAQLSCPCNVLNFSFFFSPVVWHAREKHTLCIHQSQTASDRGYSATVARYVKSLGMSFSLSGARVICKYNISGLHGLIQSKGSI